MPRETLKSLRERIEALELNNSKLEETYHSLLDTSNKLADENDKLVADNQQKGETIREAHRQLRELNEKLHETKLERVKAERIVHDKNELLAFAHRESEALNLEFQEVLKKIEQSKTYSEGEKRGLERAVRMMAGTLLESALPNEVRIVRETDGD